MKLKKIIVHHVGARDKYLIANYFKQRGILAGFVTDYWVRPNSFLGAALKGGRRYKPALDGEVVYYYPLLLVIYTLLIKKLKKNIFDRWIAVDKIFTGFVLKKIKNKEPDLIWGYTNANFEVLEYFNHSKVIMVHNQIDPGIVYYDIKQRLWEANPDFESAPAPLLDSFRNRIIGEWDLAHVIVVNSEYSKRSIVSYGADESKIIVLPLIYEQKKSFAKKVNYTDTLRVGFVGNINLIKGFKVFHDTALHLKDTISFHAAGSIHIRLEVVKQSHDYIEYTGHLDKEDMKNFYESIDVLMFPTYCDGFGMVQLEAMSYGIPVLATDFCGDVVEHGYNGFKVSSAADIEQKLVLLNENRAKLGELSVNAQHSISKYNFENFDKKLQYEFRKKGIIM